MIIFGSTGITSTTDSGVFNCPRCNNQKGYRLRQVRRFFTLYFIPLIPLDVSGRFVECTGCGGTFDQDILSYDPQAQQQEFLNDLKRIMILMAIADGAVDQAEIATIQRLYQKFGGPFIGEAEIAEEARLASEAQMDVASYARRIAAELTETGIVMVVHAAFNIASADGTLHPAKQQQMEQLPAALGISPDDLKSIIEHTEDGGE